MGSTGQRVELRVGGVAAEVALVKTSGRPKAAMHETRRVDGPPTFVPVGEEVLADETPFGFAGGDPETNATYQHPVLGMPDPPEYRHGVTREADGGWEDLTERLAEIDERTRLDGMEVAYTVASSAVPRLRVRDAHFVAPADQGATGVLAHLWQGLRDGDLAALVRWTKRTNQALGAIVASGTVLNAHLVLLELEWTASMRALPARARLGDAVEAVTPQGARAVADLLDALRGRPGVVAHMRDERAAQRAELLDAARAGHRLPEPPEPEPGPEAEVVAALERAVAGVGR
jgi:hypothetical protein